MGTMSDKRNLSAVPEDQGRKWASFRPTSEQKRNYKAAAEAENRSLSSWICMKLDEAIERERG